MSIFNSLVLGGGGTPKVAIATSPSSLARDDTMTSISFTVDGEPKEWSFVCFNTPANSLAYISSSKTIISAYSEDGRSTVCCRLYYGSGDARIVRGQGNISTSYSNGTFTLTATSGVFQKTTHTSGGTLDYVLFYTV